MNYNWNWGIFWQAAPGGQGTYAQALLSGLMFTLAVGLLAWIMALILGSIVGTVRTTPSKWAVRIGNGYVYGTFNQPTPIEGIFTGLHGRERIEDQFGNPGPGLTLFRF